jgi:succinate dehydrogenase (ubiquinone) membrane anchor subunit
MKQVEVPVCLSVAKSFSISPRREMSAGHDHTKLWTAERFLSLGLLGVIPAAFMVPSPALDYALALAIVMHSHW